MDRVEALRIAKNINMPMQLGVNQQDALKTLIEIVERIEEDAFVKVLNDTHFHIVNHKLSQSIFNYLTGDK